MEGAEDTEGREWDWAYAAVTRYMPIDTGVAEAPIHPFFSVLSVFSVAK